MEDSQGEGDFKQICKDEMKPVIRKCRRNVLQAEIPGGPETEQTLLYQFKKQKGDPRKNEFKIKATVQSESYRRAQMLQSFVGVG